MKYIVAGLMVVLLAGCSESDPAPRRAAPAQAAVTPSAPPTESEKQKALDTVFGNLHSTKVVRPSAPDKKP
jgi:type IV pilus biogenesis protein CpaD/CtpE